MCSEDIWRPAGERSVHPLPLRGTLVGTRSAHSSALTHGHTPIPALTYPSRTCGQPHAPLRPRRAAIARSGTIETRLQKATPAAALPPPPGGCGPEPRSSRETWPRAGGLDGAGRPGRRASPPNPRPGAAPREADAAAPPSFGSPRCRRRPPGSGRSLRSGRPSASRLFASGEARGAARPFRVPVLLPAARGSGGAGEGRGESRFLPSFFLRRRGPRGAVRRREAAL